jgi:hypothetical protein
MLTVIGKNLVYVTVIFALTGLGLSLWAVADQTKFNLASDKLKSEITKAKTAQNAEADELKGLLNELAANGRSIPRGPDEIAANKDISVANALKEATQIDGQLADLSNKLNGDTIARVTLINEIRSLRDKVQGEKDIGQQLRLIITPDEPRKAQGQTSFWDTLSSLQVAKEDAERRTEAMQPDLYNAAIRLQSLELRLKGMKKELNK